MMGRVWNSKATWEAWGEDEDEEGKEQTEDDKDLYLGELFSVANEAEASHVGAGVGGVLLKEGPCDLARC